MKRDPPMNKRVLTVIGTRPEAIKMAPVAAALRALAPGVETRVCLTGQHTTLVDELKSNPRFDSILCASGQHTDLVRDALGCFGIKPDVDLDLMTEQQSLSDITARCVDRLAPLVQSIEPDLVLVHGDTATTLSAALVAFYHKVPVGHVEAGLRSGDFRNPFPEEMNRILVDRIADYCFAPTLANRQNLLAEGIAENRIIVTGNTAVDALLLMHRRVSAVGQAERIENSEGFPRFATRSGDRLVLVTAHRRENWDQPLANICEAFKELVQRYPDLRIVYPVHLNPNVRRTVHTLLNGIQRIHLIEPVDYLAFIHLMKHSHLILTDSGGIQEEAPSLGKPVLVMRKLTERPEAYHAGVAKIVGTEKDSIIREVSLLLDNDEEYRKMSRMVNPYGDGKSAKRIVDVIMQIRR